MNHLLLKHKNTVHLFQNFILMQDKWEIFFWFSAKLTRYSFALQIKLLSIFDQIENSCILLAEIETTIWCRLIDENAQKHNSLIEIVKNLSVWHEIVCSQSDFWSSNCLQWQHSNQTFHFKVCFSNTAIVLSAHSEHDSHKLIDESWY